MCVLCVTVWRGEEFANINAKQAKGGGTRISKGKRHKRTAEGDDEGKDKKTEQASV